MVKRSKNKSNVFCAKDINDAWRDINNAKKITLLTHFKPDGDGISACVALEHILNNMGKKVETVYPSKSLFKFKRKPKNLFIDKHKNIPDILIILDTANYQRVYYPEVFFNIDIINIDHHISNSIKGKYNFVNPDSSSTCEILFDLLKTWDKNLINKYVAECLLFGILYDSQIFHTQSTYPQTLKVCAQLMEHGADLFALKTELLSNKNPKIIALWGKILSSIKISKNGKVAWAKVTQDDLKKYKLNLSSLIGFSNFLSQISNVDITILFYETDDNKTKVSLRSKKTDVNKFAAKFGGGGHRNAAGILSDEALEKMIKKVTKDF